MTANILQARRIESRIPGWMLCSKAGIGRTRLCGIERGYVQPEPEELRRLFVALDELIAVRSEVQNFALHLGWPGIVEFPEPSNRTSER
jgi:hypothetical protein